MEHLSFSFESDAAAPVRREAVLVGVVASGNLEVLVEPAADARCRIDVHTSARGFDAIWSAVLADFCERSSAGALQITINDAGATPAVVSLRLDQALEEFRSAGA